MTTVPEDDVEDLRAAVNEAAKHATTRFTTFLFVTAYLAVAVASTTDEDLLRESPLMLPLLGIGLPLVPFYIVMPWIYLILHGYLLFQLLLLSSKVEALLCCLKDRSELEWQRKLLFPFPTLHMLAGADMDSRVKGMALHLLNATNLLIPMLMLLGMLWRFLPYHHAWAHGVQRAAIVADLFIMGAMWPMIARSRKTAARLHAKGASAQPRQKPPLVVRMTDPALILILKVLGSKAFSVLGAVLALFVAFVLLVVPPGPLDRFVPTWSNWLEPALHRNLILRGRTLVAKPPPPEVLARYVRASDDGEPYAFDEKRAWMEHAAGLDLSGRDLRGADFTGAKLYNVGLHPRGVTQDDKIGKLKDDPERNARLRADLTGATLSYTVLSGADLRGAMLRGAILIEANLDGANLQWAELHGADLESANLAGADLREAELDGTDLRRAELHGADLRWAKLRGADLRWAELHGADLESANLAGADLAYAELHGANLRAANLHGADLREAELGGTDLRRAELYGADLRNAWLYGVEAFLAEFIGATFTDIWIETSNVGNIAFGDASSVNDWPKIAADVLSVARDDGHQKELEDRLEVALERIRRPRKELDTFSRFDTLGGPPPANWNARTGSTKLARDRAVGLADMAADNRWILKAMAMRAESYQWYNSEERDPRLALALASELLARHEKNAGLAVNALTTSELAMLRQIVDDPDLAKSIADLDALPAAPQPAATQPTAASHTQPAPTSQSASP